ncbi:MAG: hypothetical protein ABFS19_03785 [Thermodesulfobacteriota bacterium]
MAKVHISPNNATDKTIRSIDRKREQERRFMFRKVREHAEEFTTKLVQRLIDRNIIEVTNVESIQGAVVSQLGMLADMDEFDLQMKIAPLRTLVPDPNIVSLFLTQFIIEDLIENPAIQDIFGEDLEVYLAVDSIFKVLRPQ